jgi:hypothetical protein
VVWKPASFPYANQASVTLKDPASVRPQAS